MFPAHPLSPLRDAHLCVARQTHVDHPSHAKEDKDQLKLWMTKYEDRIGLERTAIRTVARDRHYRYREMVSLVSVIQHMESTVDEETRAD